MEIFTSGQRVIWSDESAFTLKYQARQRVWVDKTDKTLKTCMMKGVIKHDKKIMVWGCFSYYGVGHIYCVKGIMYAAKL